MSEFYDHHLHKEYEKRINEEVNIKDKIFKTLELHIKTVSDNTNCPEDQQTSYEQIFPLANNRIVPELTISEYIMSLNNYRTIGKLFTVRYVHPIDKFSEVIFLDPNNNGKIWLFIFGPELEEIEQIKSYNSINLTTDIIEDMYY
jgi:hypothetical protein